MKRALGLEVGRTFVALCEVVFEGDAAPRPERSGRRALAGAGEPAPEDLADAVLALAAEIGLRQRDAVLALARALTWDKPVALPPLSEEERLRLLTLQPERFFPIAERSLVCDLEEAVDGASPLAHAADADLVERLVDGLQARGFRISAVVPSATALRRAAVRGAPELRTANWMLVRSEDGDLTTLACRQGELRVSRRLEAFAERPEAALRELSRTARQAFDASAPLEQLRWIGWRDLPDGVRRLAEAQLPARARDLAEVPVGSEEIAAFGAALLATDERPRPDLLPPAVRARRRRQVRWLTAACAALAVLGALALLWALGERQERRLRGLESALAAAGPAATDAAETRDSLYALQGRIAAVEQRMGERARWIAAPEVLADALPEGAWISSLRLESPGQVGLTGYAITASALVPALERTPAFAGVELAAPATRATVGARELEAFNLRTVLEGSAADSARVAADTSRTRAAPTGTGEEGGP